MRILIITDLDFQSAGNQVLPKTIEGITSAGHHIHLLTPAHRQERNNLISEAGNRLVAHEFNPVFRGLLPLLRHTVVEGLQRRRQDSNNANSDFSERKFQALYTSGAPRPFTTNNTYNSWIHFGQMISFFLGAIPPAVRIMNAEKIDLVCGYEVMGAPVAFVLGRMFRLPCVSKYQGTFVYPYMRTLRGMLKVGSFTLPLLLPVDMVFMENDGTKGDFVLRRLGIKENRIAFMVGGVDKLRLLRPADRDEIRAMLGIPRDASVVLSVNKFKYWKRIDRIIRSFSSVAKHIEKACLVLVGHGTEEVYLQELARRSAEDSRIIFAGGVPHDRIADYYAIADVYMITNDVSNLGLPLLEAMVCGCCILSLADGSLDGLLSDGENARLVQPDESDAELVAALEYLLAHEEERRRLGLAAKKTAEHVVKSWEQRAQQEVNLLEAVVRAKQQAP